jgi:rare lipoprotein A
VHGVGSAAPPSATGNPTSYVVFGQRYFVLGSSEGFQEQGYASWYGDDFHGKRTSSGVAYDMYAMTAAHKHLPIPTHVRVENLENGRNIVVEVNDRGPFVDGRVIDLSYAAASELGVVGPGTAQVRVTALAPYQYLPGSLPNGDNYLTQVATGEAAPTKTLADASLRPPPATQTVAGGLDSQVGRTPYAPPPSPAVYETSPESTAHTSRQASAPSAPEPLAPAVAFETAPAGPSSIGAASADYEGAMADHSQPLYLQVGAFSDLRNAEILQTRLSDRLNRMIRIEFGTGQLYKVRVGPIGTLAEANQVTLQLATLGIDQPHLVAE